MGRTSEAPGLGTGNIGAAFHLLLCLLLLLSSLMLCHPGWLLEWRWPQAAPELEAQLKERKLPLAPPVRGLRGEERLGETGLGAGAPCWTSGRSEAGAALPPCCPAAQAWVWVVGGPRCGQQDSRGHGVAHPSKWGVARFFLVWSRGGWSQTGKYGMVQVNVFVQ